MDKNVIKELIKVCKRLDDKGMVNACEGNVSIKKDEYMYITPSQKNKALLTEEMIVVIDLDTMEQVSGTYKPSSEMKLHVRAYEKRNDIASVIHCHSPYLTSFSLRNKAIESKSYPELMIIFKTIPVAAYGRPGTNAIFDGIDSLLVDNNVVIMANHGMICVGESAVDTMNRAEASEAIAKVVYLAEACGDIVDLPADEVDFLRNV